MNQILIYFLIFITYSFLGWCLEVICKLVDKGKFINRGFLIGPICPVYGFGALIMQIFLVKYLNDPITLFIMIILSCSILEYITSFALEKMFATRWWDYSNYKFNINGRICLETMIPFGFFGMLIMYKINPFFLNLYQQIPNNWLYLISIPLLLAFLADTIISFNIINNIKKISKETQKKQIIKKDDTEKITELVKKQIIKSKKKLQRRIIQAFPHLQLLKRKRTKK